MEIAYSVRAGEIFFLLKKNHITAPKVYVGFGAEEVKSHVNQLH